MDKKSVCFGGKNELQFLRIHARALPTDLNASFIDHFMLYLPFHAFFLLEISCHANEDIDKSVDDSVDEYLDSLWPPPVARIYKGSSRKSCFSLASSATYSSASSSTSTIAIMTIKQ